MIRLMLMGVALAFSVGCANHYYKDQGGLVEIYLDKPNVHQVIFASSLDDFEPHEARNVYGLWVVSVPNDSPFRYYYVVDGKVYTPPCELKENDDFGSQNCIFDPHL